MYDIVRTTHYHGPTGLNPRVFRWPQEQVESYLIGGVKQDIKETHSLDSNYEADIIYSKGSQECQ